MYLLKLHRTHLNCNAPITCAIEKLPKTANSLGLTVFELFDRVREQASVPRKGTRKNA